MPALKLGVAMYKTKFDLTIILKIKFKVKFNVTIKTLIEYSSKNSNEFFENNFCRVNY